MFIFLVHAVLQYLVRKSNMWSRNPPVTLSVSDRSRCGAMRIVISVAQPFSVLCACRIALVVAQCEIWYRSPSPLDTLCASDRSRCGVVLILADSLRSCKEIFWILRKILQEFHGAVLEVCNIWMNRVLSMSLWEDVVKILKLDDGWPESVEEQGLLLLVWRRNIRNDIWKLCYRQSRRGVSRQNSEKCKTIVCIANTFTHRRFYTTLTLLHTKLLPTEAFTHRSFYIQKLLHTEVFTYKHFYTQTLLHTNALTHRRFYTQTLLHTDPFTHRRLYTQTLLHTDAFYTQTLFTNRRFDTQTHLHTDAFTHRGFYTQTLFTHRRFDTQTLLHTDAFTHKRFYTNTFTHKHFYTQTLLHTDAFTHRDFYTQRRFYTQKLLHTDAFTHRRFYTQTKGLLWHRKNRNFTSVSTDRPSFRAKGLLRHRKNCNFTSVFADRPSFRAKGLLRGK